MKWQRHYQHGSGSLETSSYAEEERISLAVSPSEQDKQERDKSPQGEAKTELVAVTCGAEGEAWGPARNCGGWQGQGQNPGLLYMPA